MDYASPQDDEEHAHLGAFRFPGSPLAYDGYSGWVFLLYLSKAVQGGPGLVARLLTKMATTPDGESALDQAIPGGLARQFPEFALYAWNQSPIEESRIG